jgi:transposase-like protein
MAGRKVFNEQDARRCLAAVKATRRTLATWAREHGVDGRSLNLWRVNLERRGVVRTPTSPPRLVELVVAPPPGAVRAPLVLRAGGVEVEVNEHFDDALLRRLIGVLKSC